MTGPGPSSPSADCVYCYQRIRPFDFDHDRDVDLADYAAFQNSLIDRAAEDGE